MNVSVIRGLVALYVAVIFAITAIAIWGPDNSSLANTALISIGAIATLGTPAILGLRAAFEAKAAAEIAVESSKQNSTAISEINDKVDLVNDSNIEIHKIVNSRSDALIADNKILREELARVHGLLVASQRDLTQERQSQSPRQSEEKT